VVLYYVLRDGQLRLQAMLTDGTAVPADPGGGVELAEQIWKAGRAVTFDRLVHPEGSHPFLEAAGVASLLGTAVGLGSKAPGVIAVGNRHYRRFMDGDRALLALMGDRIATAVDRALAIEAEQRAIGESLAAQENARLREEFISVAAHELKTPVAALRLAAQLLVRRRETGREEARSTTLLEQVLHQTERIDRLVSQLLDVARLQVGRFQVDLAEADIAAVARDVVGVMRATSGRVIALDAPETARAVVDAPRLEQVLFNLLDNAVKYSPAETPVEVSLEHSAHALTLAVRDHGPGIAPASREHIFERFHRGEEGSRTAGLGLGLHVSQEIARAHGGEIAAEFPEDGGSLFRVTIPLPAAGK
jgi:signal transduction histidine kinase